MGTKKMKKLTLGTETLRNTARQLEASEMARVGGASSHQGCYYPPSHDGTCMPYRTPTGWYDRWGHFHPH